MDFASRVRDLLDETGMTQEELARASGLKLRQLQRYIAKKGAQVPGMPNAEAIAKGLGVSISKLIAEEEPVVPYSDTLPPALAEFFAANTLTDSEKDHLRRYYRSDGPVTDPVLLSGILTQYRLVQRDRAADSKHIARARKDAEAARRELEADDVKVIKKSPKPPKGK